MWHDQQRGQPSPGSQGLRQVAVDLQPVAGQELDGAHGTHRRRLYRRPHRRERLHPQARPIQVRQDILARSRSE